MVYLFIDAWFLANMEEILNELPTKCSPTRSRVTNKFRNLSILTRDFTVPKQFPRDTSVNLTNTVRFRNFRFSEKIHKKELL